MRIRKSDTEPVDLDTAAVLRHYIGPDASFSMSMIEVEGTHRNDSGSELAYFVVEGDGHVHLGDRIITMQPDDVVYVGTQEHELEGDMRLLAVRSPPADSEDDVL